MTPKPPLSGQGGDRLVFGLLERHGSVSLFTGTGVSLLLNSAEGWSGFEVSYL